MKTVTLKLDVIKAQGLLSCLLRTSAKGYALDVGEEVETILCNFIKKQKQQNINND